MNVLFVTYHYLKGNGGGIFASRAYINAFAEIAEKITLLYPYKVGMDASGISDKVEKIPVSDSRTIMDKVVDFYHGRIHRMYRCFESYLKNRDYDLVVFDNSKSSGGLIDIAHKYDVKVITIHHNCELEYNRDNTSLLFRSMGLYMTKIYEGDAVNKSELNLVLTKQDKDLLSVYYDKSGQSKIYVIGVFESRNSEVPSFLTEETGLDETFVITGNLSAMQTEKSLLPWLDVYYPVLKEVFPNAKLTIAGKNPTKSIRHKCSIMGVDLIPSPESMVPILQSHHYYICPTSLGGGLKLRIMDGLKCGMPVISHRVSTRGYDQFVEKGYVLSYSDIDSFRDVLNSLYTHKIDKVILAKDYLDYFNFSSGVTRLRNIINSSL